jgi:hypothetical protein
VDAAAAVVVAAHWADTLITPNSVSATNTANNETTIFLIFFSPILWLDYWDQAHSII